MEGSLLRFLVLLPLPLLLLLAVALRMVLATQLAPRGVRSFNAIR
jgi:hypothetical protein